MPRTTSISIAALLLVGCLPEGAFEIPGERRVEVGLAAAFSGPGIATQVAEETLLATRLAMEGRDAPGGRDWELTTADSGCDPDAGLAAANELAAIPGLLAVLGTTCSVAGLTAAPILSDAGLAIVSPSNTHPDLTAPATRSPGYFRVAGNDVRQALVLAAWLRDIHGVSSAVVVHEGTSWGLAMEEAIHSILPASDAPDLTYLVLPAAEAGLAAEDADTAWVAGPDSLLDPYFLGNPAAEGTLISRWADTTDPTRYAELLDAWVDQHGAPPDDPFHAHAFDAAELLLDAIDAAAIEGASGRLWIDPTALREALADTRMRQGVSGLLTCDDQGDCSTETVELLQVVGGVAFPLD